MHTIYETTESGKWLVKIFLNIFIALKFMMQNLYPKILGLKQEDFGNEVLVISSLEHVKLVSYLFTLLMGKSPGAVCQHLVHNLSPFSF